MGTQVRRVVGFTAGFIFLMFVFQNCGEGYNKKESRVTSSNTGATTVTVPSTNEIAADEIVDVDRAETITDNAVVNNVVNSSSTSLLNFVAGDRLSCQSAVKKRLGAAYYCQIGAGCGMSCGIPGGNCESANPNHYGVCIEVDSQNNVVNHSSNSVLIPDSGNQLYNIVAGDKATCERTAQQITGQAESCFTGGGCGMTCGMPGGNCASANPNVFGICIEVNPNQEVVDVSEPQMALGSGPASPLTSSSNLMNFVNGMGKAACEQQIRDRFGVGYTCLRGGGCGISCGMPGGNCQSANPQHFGLCLYAPNGTIQAVTPGSTMIQ